MTADRLEIELPKAQREYCDAVRLWLYSQSSAKSKAAKNAAGKRFYALLAQVKEVPNRPALQ